MKLFHTDVDKSWNNFISHVTTELDITQKPMSRKPTQMEAIGKCNQHSNSGAWTILMTWQLTINETWRQSFLYTEDNVHKWQESQYSGNEIINLTTPIGIKMHRLPNKKYTVRGAQLSAGLQMQFYAHFSVGNFDL